MDIREQGLSDIKAILIDMQSQGVDIADFLAQECSQCLFTETDDKLHVDGLAFAQSMNKYSQQYQGECQRKADRRQEDRRNG